MSFVPAAEPSQSSAALLARLAAVLPKGYTFGIYHLSTPPTRTEALFQAPVGDKPDRTYCESHFLAVTVDVAAADAPVLVLALEIFLFTTAYASTFFVSKADTSGYLHLLQLPKGTPSPIRTVCSAFLGYLVEQRRRPHIQSVVTLFARAQSQYLFPGSVDNAGKHVLDDRGLVKWWCRVLDPLLEQSQTVEPAWSAIRGYLLVPGLDHYETRAYIPRTPTAAQWTVGHPLREISHYVRDGSATGAPVAPRCLIPQYPDDPKSRFRDELDDEAEHSEQWKGAWQSVQTVDQFWEMMAFRQECSSGRLTGFLWVVLDPRAEPSAAEAQVRVKPAAADKKKPQKARVLTGRIAPRLPRIKTQQRSYFGNRPQSTAYFFWPPEGRGSHVVEEADFKRTIELLLQLDFSTLEKSVISTTRWLKEAGMGSDWRLQVTGLNEAPPDPAQASDVQKRKRAPSGATPEVNTLDMGLVRRKKKDPAGGEEPAAVNTLSAGLLRKKPKVRV